MVSTKEELVASNIRKQIAYLEVLLKELESDSGRSALINQRIREVESQLHKLRSTFTI
jgi:hypothetical protein